MNYIFINWKNVPINLSNLKNKADKFDVEKLVPVSVDLSKINDIVKNDAIKKDVYNAKIKNIEDRVPNLTNVATNTTLNAKLDKLKKGIPIITNVATTSSLNNKINEVKNKIPNITNLATTTVFTVV